MENIDSALYRHFQAVCDSYAYVYQEEFWNEILNL